MSVHSFSSPTPTFLGVQHVPSTKWGCGKTYNQTQMEGSWFCLTMFKPIWEKFPFNLLVFLTSSIMTSCLDLIPIVASETIGIFISPGIIPLKPTTKNGIPTMNPNQPWFQAMISCLLCSELAMFTPNLDVKKGKTPCTWTPAARTPGTQPLLVLHLTGDPMIGS